MKFSLECKVDSKILIKKVMKIVQGKKEFILTPNREGMLAFIKIITSVDDPEKFYSKIKNDDEKAIESVTINSDPVVRNELISDFQYIESTLSFYGNLKRINWSEPKREWIPETDVEKSRCEVVGAQFERKNPDSPTILTREIIEETIADKNKFDCLTTLRSFYREGKNALMEFRYIYAFYNFYFILEDLFGGGKTKNKQIEENFKSSMELKDTINWVMIKFINPDKKHSKNISILLCEKNLDNNAKDIIRLLIRLRGQLHHFSRKSSRKQPTPFSQRDFESLAFLTMGIALKSILNEIVKINKKDNKDQS